MAYFLQDFTVKVFKCVEVQTRHMQFVQSRRVHVGKYSCVSFDKALNQTLEYTQIPIIRVDIKRKMLKKKYSFLWLLCGGVCAKLLLS